MEQLEGRAAVVTGGGSGIGEGIIGACVEAGMRVVVADIDLDEAERVASAARESGADALAVQGGRLRPHRNGRPRRARLRGVRRGQPALL